MHSLDNLQRFMFEHAAIRGELIHLNHVYQTVSQQRLYPPKIKQLLAEAMMSCILLVGAIKFEGEISVQFQGDKRLPLILVQGDHELRIRACATFKEQLSDDEYLDAFLHGTMVINLTPHNQTQTYQSIVPITSVSMSDNLMNYFAQSEQITTKVWFAVSDTHAAGVMLQLMPGQNTEQREHFWEYAVHIGETITKEELITLDNTTLLHRLYHETELRLYPERIIHHQCRCTPDKMQHVIGLLGEADAMALLKEQGQIDIRCEFCNKKYTFDAIDVTLLFHKKQP